MNEKPELPDYVQQITKDLFRDARDGLSPRLRKYSESAQAEIILNDMNLYERSLITPAIHHGFVDCKFKERRNLERLEEGRENMINEYVEKYGKSGAKRYETKAMAENSEAIKQIDEAIKSQKEVIKYLEEICDIMSRQNFSVKNAVEMVKQM